MPIGSATRQLLGRWEIPAADFYRNRFINLEDLAATVASLTDAKRILEVGCGDGVLGEHLTRAFPEAHYVGIDIAPEIGRLFHGDASRAQFQSTSTGDYLAQDVEPFDLVVVADVVHHVAEQARLPLLRDCGDLTAPTGMLAVKEWERGSGLAHATAYVADRWVSGDATVRFHSRSELKDLIAAALPEFRPVCEARIPPRRNNVLYALRRR